MKLVRVKGKLRWAVLVGLVCATPLAAQQDRPAHWLHAGAMPPGAIGRQRLIRGGPLSPYNPVASYCQPVRIRAPEGARVATTGGSGFASGTEQPLLVGLRIGPVYRFKVTDLPNYPGVEVFPTVELVDRLHPPPGKAAVFPVPVELTLEELLLAADGKFVTRVIYVEDPQLAAAIARTPDQEQSWVEARGGDDPLLMAKAYGRPIAILRLGGRLPDRAQVNQAFLYGSVQPQIIERPKPNVDGNR